MYFFHLSLTLKKSKRFIIFFGKTKDLSLTLSRKNIKNYLGRCFLNLFRFGFWCWFHFAFLVSTTTTTMWGPIFFLHPSVKRQESRVLITEGRKWTKNQRKYGLTLLLWKENRRRRHCYDETPILRGETIFVFFEIVF